jgi:hypothetical protein
MTYNGIASTTVKLIRERVSIKKIKMIQIKMRFQSLKSIIIGSSQSKKIRSVYTPWEG